MRRHCCVSIPHKSRQSASRGISAVAEFLVHKGHVFVADRPTLASAVFVSVLCNYCPTLRHTEMIPRLQTSSSVHVSIETCQPVMPLPRLTACWWLCALLQIRRRSSVIFIASRRGYGGLLLWSTKLLTDNRKYLLYWMWVVALFVLLVLHVCNQETTDAQLTISSSSSSLFSCLQGKHLSASNMHRAMGKKGTECFNNCHKYVNNRDKL